MQDRLSLHKTSKLENDVGVQTDDTAKGGLTQFRELLP